MQKKYEEIYADDKEDLSQLIQEWIDENVFNICCQNNRTELKCNQNRS